MTRSKVKVMRPLKLEILRFSSIFKIYLLRYFNVTTDSENMEQYLTFVRSRFLISVLVFVSRDYELGMGWHWFSLQMILQLQLHSLGGGGVRRQPQSRTGLIFLFVNRVGYFRWNGDVGSWHNKISKKNWGNYDTSSKRDEEEMIYYCD